MADEVKLQTPGLDKIIKALKVPPPHIRVGILGSHNARSGGPSNAEIGAAHEFGTSMLPVRSFLRVPIADQLPGRLKDAGLTDPDTLKEVIKTGSLLAWAKKIGICAEGIVADAFDTGGFGKWKPSNMALKKNHQTLVETQQLRNSISSEVKE